MLVDSGNIFFKPGTSSANHQVANGIPLAIAEVYRILGYNAISPSVADLALGMDFYLSQRGKDLPFISANIADQHGKPIFPPVKNFTVNGLQIAVCGITGGGEQLPAGIRLLSWRESLDAVREVLERHDFVILLSSLSEQENREITANYPEVNLLLSSTGSSGNKHPVLSNASLLAQSEPRGKYLGKLELEVSSNGRWQLAGQQPSATEQYRRQLEGLQWQQEKIRIKELPEAEKNSLLHELTSQIDLVQQKLSEAEVKANKREEAPINRFQSIFLPVTPLPHPVIDPLLIQARVQHAVNRHPLPAKQPWPLAGSQQCQSCHQSQYALWQSTAHASAYQTLQAKQQERNLECLGCHITSPLAQAARDRDPSVALLSLDQSALAVGCETCHGSGLTHSKAPTQNPMSGPVSQDTCLACHTDERDDDFNFTSKRNLIACPLNG